MDVDVNTPSLKPLLAFCQRTVVLINEDVDIIIWVAAAIVLVCARCQTTVKLLELPDQYLCVPNIAQCQRYDWLVKVMGEGIAGLASSPLLLSMTPNRNGFFVAMIEVAC